MKDKQCHRCKEREGDHRMLVTESGTLGPLHEIWYCEPCYQYLKQEFEKNSCCEGWGGCCDHVKPTVIVGPPAMPLQIPDVVTIPKFVGDRPLPDIRSILANNALKTTNE